MVLGLPKYAKASCKNDCPGCGSGGVAAKAVVGLPPARDAVVPDCSSERFFLERLFVLPLFPFFEADIALCGRFVLLLVTGGVAIVI